MTARRYPTGLLAAVLLGACSAVAPVVHTGAAHWSYAGADGPDAWSTLAPEYSACRTGRFQSPLDLDNAVFDGNLSALRLEYTPAVAEIANNGHTVQATFRDGGVMHWGDREYKLLQLHHHRPGEHTVAGRPADLEIHLVHRAADGSFAAVALLLDEGAAPSAVVGALIAAGAAGDPILRDIDPASILPADLGYITYDGSLTTPPCSEGVRWIVLRERGSVSRGQLARLGALLPPNARPALPAAGRHIRRTSPR